MKEGIAAVIFSVACSRLKLAVSGKLGLTYAAAGAHWQENSQNIPFDQFEE